MQDDMLSGAMGNMSMQQQPYDEFDPLNAAFGGMLLGPFGGRLEEVSLVVDMFQQLRHPPAISSLKWAGSNSRSNISSSRSNSSSSHSSISSSVVEAINSVEAMV